MHWMMTEQMYSDYFGFNALGALAGPLLYIWLSWWFSPGNIIASGFGLLTICGIVLNVTGSHLSASRSELFCPSLPGISC